MYIFLIKMTSASYRQLSEIYRRNFVAKEAFQSRGSSHVTSGYSLCQRQVVKGRYIKSTIEHLTAFEEDGSEMLDTAVAAAGTLSDSGRHQPGWLITRRQDDPHRVSCGEEGKSRSHQCRHRTSPDGRLSSRL